MDEYVDRLRARGLPPHVIDEAVARIESACHAQCREPWELYGSPAELVAQPQRLAQQPQPRTSKPAPRRPMATWRDALTALAKIAGLFTGYFSGIPFAVMVRALRLGYRSADVPQFALTMPASLLGMIVLLVLLSAVTSRLATYLLSTIVIVTVGIALVVTSFSTQPVVSVSPYLFGGLGVVMLGVGSALMRSGALDGDDEDRSSWIGAYVLIFVLCAVWVFFDPHLQHVPTDDGVMRGSPSPVLQLDASDTTRLIAVATTPTPST